MTFSVARGKTYVHRSFVSHPFHLTRPWYLDERMPDMAVIYVQTPAGGLIQGDRTRLRFELDCGAHVHITTQAAEKIHRMTANCAVQQVEITLGAAGYAEYCPEPIILFPGARLAQSIHIELAAKAAFFFCEMFIAPTLRTGVPFAGLSNRLHIQNSTGRLLVAERSLVIPTEKSLGAPGILGNAHCWGQVVFVTDTVSATCARTLHERLACETRVVSGVSTLSGSQGLIVKALGSDVGALRDTLHAAWDYVRTTYRGVTAPRFPK